MTGTQRATHTLANSLNALLVLAHVLAGLSLVAFGWPTGGYALNGQASHAYLVLSVLAGGLLAATWRRQDAWTSAARITLSAWLAFALVCVWLATATLGAKYAPYGLDAEIFGLANLSYAMLGCGLALLLRYPQLLRVWVLGHALLLALSTAAWFNAVRFGTLIPNPPDLVPWLLIGPMYALAAVALGWQPGRKAAWQAVVLVLGGFTLGVLAVPHLPFYAIIAGAIPSEYFINAAWAALTIGLPISLTVTPGWLAWQAGRDWDAMARSQLPAMPVWVGQAIAILAGTLLTAHLLAPDMLPRAGEVQGWVSQTHSVPTDAWLPTLGSSRGLLQLLPWLLIPLVASGVFAWWPQRRQADTTPATWLILAAVATLLVLVLPTVTRTFLVMNVVSGGFRPAWFAWSLFTPLPFALTFGLLFAARLHERSLPAGWRAGMALASCGMLVLFACAQAASAWAFARFLVAPLPAWQRLAEYAPAPPWVLAAAGLAQHLLLLVSGLVMFIRWLRATSAEWRGQPPLWAATRRAAVAGALALSIAAAGWYALTWPRVTAVTPLPGSAGVPRDVVVTIGLPPRAGWEIALASGFIGGLQTRYADSGEHIPGTTGMGAQGLTFIPDGLLRPNAPVEIAAQWANKRPFVLRFTTGGDSAGQTASPPAGWPQPLATAQPLGDAAP